MFRELARGRFLGHPVHVMLVHFPIVLFLAGVACDGWGYASGNKMLHHVALYAIIGGLGTGVLAAIFGAIDYIGLAGQADLFQKASWHAGIQTTVMAIFGVVAGIRLQEFPDAVEPGNLQLVAMAIAAAMMLAGNYLGADLVYRDGVGVHKT